MIDCHTLYSIEYTYTIYIYHSIVTIKWMRFHYVWHCPLKIPFERLTQKASSHIEYKTEENTMILCAYMFNCYSHSNHTTLRMCKVHYILWIVCGLKEYQWIELFSMQCSKKKKRKGINRQWKNNNLDFTIEQQTLLSVQ